MFLFFLLSVQERNCPVARAVGVESFGPSLRSLLRLERRRDCFGRLLVLPLPRQVRRGCLIGFERKVHGRHFFFN